MRGGVRVIDGWMVILVPALVVTRRGLRGLRCDATYNVTLHLEVGKLPKVGTHTRLAQWQAGEADGVLGGPPFFLSPRWFLLSAASRLIHCVNFLLRYKDAPLLSLVTSSFSFTPRTQSQSSSTQYL